MAPPSNVPRMHLREMSLELVSPDEADVFLLSSYDSHTNVRAVGTVSLKEMGEMKAQCLLYHLYRALHAGRKALIG